MAKVTINDGASALSVRTNINAMFTNLFTYGFFAEKLVRSGGTPSTGDPAALDTVSHTLVGTYTAAPIAILIMKCDWHCYISSVSTTTVVVGVGSFGSGITLDYDILILSRDV